MARSTETVSGVTPWFPVETNPVRVGVYEITCDVGRGASVYGAPAILIWPCATAASAPSALSFSGVAWRKSLASAVTARGTSMTNERGATPQSCERCLGTGKEPVTPTSSALSENWLLPGSVVPVDVPTTAALLAEIKRLRALRSAERPSEAEICQRSYVCMHCEKRVVRLHDALDVITNAAPEDKGRSDLALVAPLVAAPLSEIAASTSAASSAIGAMELPPMNAEMVKVLGRLGMYCGPIAEILRHGGHAIKTRIEDEQAAVLHWSLGLYLQHGAAWAEKGDEILQSYITAIKAHRAEGAMDRTGA